jgi:hypothetical protein
MPSTGLYITVAWGELILTDDEHRSRGVICIKGLHSSLRFSQFGINDLAVSSSYFVLRGLENESSTILNHMKR